MNSTDIYEINDVMYHHDLRLEKQFKESFDKMLREQLLKAQEKTDENTKRGVKLRAKKPEGTEESAK